MMNIDFRYSLRINAHAKERRRKLQIQLCDNQFKLKITQRENLTVFLAT